MKHMKAKIAVLEERVRNQDEARRLAVGNVDARLEHMNELRADLQRMEGTFISKASFEDRHALLQGQVDVLRMSAAELKGKANQSSVIWAIGIALVGVIFGVIEIVLKFTK